MVYYIRLNDQKSDPPRVSIVKITTELPEDELVPAMRAAVKEFLATNSRERDLALDAAGNMFGWNDATVWLPDELTKSHGFVIDNVHMSNICLDASENLINLMQEEKPNA